MAELISLRWQDREIRAEAELVNGVWWIHADGEMFRFDPREGRARRNRGGAADGGGLVAPMPGKITKILKNSGDAVERGEAVLVMEAMKMEYTLKADVAGSVAELSCAVGDQVALGQALATIQPRESGA
jgi:acetyl/propionyl-CoA carboxylase alpha subunit